MSYEKLVNDLAEDADQLEQLYLTAQKAGESAAFKQAIDESYTGAPGNLLYAAWFYRLRSAAGQARESFVQWAWVIPLAILNGVIFWWLSDDSRYTVRLAGRGAVAPTDYTQTLLLLAAPITAVFVLIYLTAAGRRNWRPAAVIGAILLASGAYVLWVYPRLGPQPFQEQYLTLSIMHLALLAWAGVGAFLVADHRDADNRFAFLSKSLEVAILGGLFLIAGGIFTGITVALFSALEVDFPVPVQRIFIAGGVGLIPVVAVGVLYNPALPPAEQSFDEGLSKLVALLMRVMLPLTLIVLVVYLAFIPFNFREPFDNRDVLVIYNGMLFAVMALLVGATPVNRTDLAPRLARWLRWGIMAVAALALIVSLYALSAIVYRTAIDRLTPNRLAFIGWNVINIGLLALILFYQARAGVSGWVDALHRAFGAGTVVYTVWTLLVIFVVPWLFGFNQGALESLPVSVQEVVFEYPEPILLKCIGSDPIYLLEAGEKRWIDTIDTFENRGYVWRDVHFIRCDDLRSVPDGVPIPPDAGPPPQP